AGDSRHPGTLRVFHVEHRRSWAELASWRGVHVGGPGVTVSRLGSMWFHVEPKRAPPSDRGTPDSMATPVAEASFHVNMGGRQRRSGPRSTWVAGRDAAQPRST